MPRHPLCTLIRFPYSSYGVSGSLGTRFLGITFALIIQLLRRTGCQLGSLRDYTTRSAKIQYLNPDYFRRVSATFLDMTKDQI